MQNSRWHDPLGSSASGCYSDPDVEMQFGGDYENEDDEAFISFTTTESKCEKLFEQGLGLRLRGDLEQALHCFLDCMKGMQECQYFAKLPQTLRELGEVYNQMGVYDKAVEFAQAEKLFYEAVIVESERDGGQLRPKGRRARRPFSKRSSSTLANRRGSNPAEYGDMLIKKAEEFDQLCRVCAQKNKFDLALDYCGKAAKIRQSVFGAEHPATVATLERFTVLYAEVGRADYVSALHSLKADECTDNGEKGDLLSDVNVLTAKEDSEQSTHVELQGTNEGLQFNCEGKHVLKPSGNNVTSLSTQEETHSPLEDTHIPGPSLSVESEHSLQETEPSLNDNTKQETTSHTHSNEDSCLQTIAFEGQGKESAPVDRQLFQPSASSAKMQDNKNIQGPNVNIQSKHAFNSPLSSLHSIHKELNSIKELPGCAVVWQGENRGIEQSRCLPFWVLLLGAFIEMAILAYLLFAQ